MENLEKSIYPLVYRLEDKTFIFHTGQAADCQTLTDFKKLSIQNKRTDSDKCDMLGLIKHNDLQSQGSW